MTFHSSIYAPSQQSSMIFSKRYILHTDLFNVRKIIPKPTVARIRLPGCPSFNSLQATAPSQKTRIAEKLG
jgi:hypothetical protein